MALKFKAYQQANFILILVLFSLLYPSQSVFVQARAQNLPINQELGGTFKFDAQTSSPFLKVGCLDHRTLMFIVHEIEGADPQAAQLLSERDCRPLMKDAEYMRCGLGGYAHPNKGDPLTYSAYCRKGAKDLQLYVLDIQMRSVK